MSVEEYADKLERFVALWREKLITDAELVVNVQLLTREMGNIDEIIVAGNYVIPSPQTKTHTQDALQDTGHIDAGPYWHG